MNQLPIKNGPDATRGEVYAAIDGERKYQEKWGTSDTKGRHTNLEFLVYIRDYVEEALHLGSRVVEHECAEQMRHIMRKIAALGVVAMEQNGVEVRK